VKDGNNANLPSQPNPPGLAGSCAVLVLAILLTFPAFAWFGFARHGADGLVAAAVAGGVCLFGALAALVVSGLLRGPRSGVHGMLLSVLFRTGVPLMAGIFFAQRGGRLAEAGVLGMILVYYLVTLAVETVLAVRLLRPSCKTSKVS